MQTSETIYRLLTVIAIAAMIGLPVSPAIAQDAHEIRPGASVLDTTPIRSGTDSLAIFIVLEEEAVPIGSYVIQTTVQDATITRNERMLGVDDELIWGEEFVVEDGTLAFISTRGLVGGGEEQVSHAFESPSFHSNSLDLVLRSLPLTAGYRTTVVIFDAETREELSLPIHVERAATLSDVNGVASTTWEVHVDLDGAVDVYHIEQETHELIRYESALERMVMLRW